MSDLDKRAAWSIALLGSVGALLGAAMGVLGAVWVADRTYDHQLEEASLHRRVQTYQDVIASVEGVSGIIQQRTGFRSTMDPPRPDVTRILSTARGLVNLQHRLDEPLARLSLYGSPEAVAAGGQLRTAVTNTVVAAVIAVAENSDKRYKELQACEHTLEQVQADFVAVIRSDLT